MSQSKLELYQKALRLKELYNHPAWSLFLDSLEGYVKLAQQKELSYEGSDGTVLMSLHQKVLSSQDFYYSILLGMNRATEIAEIGEAFLKDQEPLPGMQ